MREKLGQVKKSNFDDYVKLRDTDPYGDFIKLVNEYEPNLIGLSIIDGTIKYGLSFIEKIKEKNIPVVTGGVGTTFNYKKILSSELVRYACIGEGEHAIVELANAIYYKTDTTNIQNIFTKDKDGNIILNSLRPPIDLNTLPIPDFDIYEDWGYVS